MYLFSNISQHWDDAGSVYPSPRNKGAYLSYMGNAVTADDLGPFY